MRASQSTSSSSPVAVFSTTSRSTSPLPLDLANLGGDDDPHFPLLLEPARLAHGRLERAEAIAAVDERDRKTRRVLETKRPVERGVTAADDDAALVPEDVLLLHEVVEPAALPLVDAIDPELPRLEGAVPRRHDHDSRRKGLAGLGRDDEVLLAVGLDAVERGDLLAQMHLWVELEALLDAEVDEALALHLRMPGDVEEVLLRVDRRDLTTELLEALDDPDGRVPVSRVVGRSKPDRPAADDGDVADVACHVPFQRTEWLGVRRPILSCLRHRSPAPARRPRLERDGLEVRLCSHGGPAVLSDFA